jgi:dTDP-4-amino-4,6-dideoxygalactose transaminase
MPQWQAQRLNYAEAIWAAARECSALRVPVVPEGTVHAAYKCYVFVKPEALKDGWDRDRILSEIAERGVPSFSGSCSEVYLEKAFDGTDYRPAQPLLVARELGETSLMFLVHPTLIAAEIEKTCAVLQDVMGLATEA